MLSDVSEDYLRTVYEITQAQGYARPKDVSGALGVSSATVTGMIRKLSEAGLINHEKHGIITLTEEGLAHAAAVRRRYEFFLVLLQSAGVDGKKARSEASLLEHGIRDETLERLLSLHGRIVRKR
jgi:DtxR family Mn-dependent transcriptional regulator